MENIKKRYKIVYLFCILLCILSYIVFTKNIRLSLIPHITLIGYFFNYNFNYIPNLGYEEAGGLFTIAKSCLGINLFISLFLILIFGFLDEYDGFKKKMLISIIFYFVSIILAFVITILRISISIPFCIFPNFKLIHTILSLIIYFSSGFILYIITKITLRKRCLL